MHTEPTIHQASCVHYATTCLLFPDLHSGTRHFSRRVFNVKHEEIAQVLLNELPLPFVNDLKPLGNILQGDYSITIKCN